MKFKIINRYEIEWFVDSFWDIEMDLPSLHEKLEMEGLEPYEVKKILIHIGEKEAGAEE